MIKDHEVLVHIRAAGLHVGDCFAVRGSPFVMRGGDRLPFGSVGGIHRMGDVITKLRTLRLKRLDQRRNTNSPQSA